MSMSPVSSAVLTGGIVAAANVVDKKGLSFRQVAGVGIYAIMLAGINEWSPEIAGKFALLVLLGAAFMYVPTIVTATGFGAGK